MLKLILGCACLGVFAAPVMADDEVALPSRPFTMDVAAALSADPTAEPVAPSAKRTPYGVAGTDDYQWYVTLGVAVANDTEGNTDSCAFANFSTFLADGLEVLVEVGAWYIHQDGPDTGGGSFSLGVRYHFYETLVEGTQERDFTLFVEAALGMLFAGNKVPDGGSNVAFLPRLGFGFTKLLTDDVRLLAEVRWHHVSNARTLGDNNNPDRNSVMGVVAIVFPF